MKMKRMKKLILFVLILFGISFTSCEKWEKEGCTNPLSLNFDYSAEQDNGTCEYSTLVFYSEKTFRYDSIDYVNITINDINLGTIHSNNVDSLNELYDDGSYVNNCLAFGTKNYHFNDSYLINWNATIYLTNGDIKHNSGQLEPNPHYNCIKIDVSN